MKLFLTSSGLGNHRDKLAKLTDGVRVGLVGNATDDVPAALRAEWLGETMAELRNSGLDVTEIDLRNFWDQPQLLADTLEGIDICWVGGGNTFLLAQSYVKSGFAQVAVPKILSNQLVYAGTSAGSVITSASLHGIETVDNPKSVADGYNFDTVWDGLGLLPYNLIPHAGEDPVIDRCEHYFARRNLPYRMLADGDIHVTNTAGRRTVYTPTIPHTYTPRGTRQGGNFHM